MSKQRLTPQQAASAIADSVLTFSAQATQHIDELLIPREPFLKRLFSSGRRNIERLEVLKLNCDMVIAHVAVTESTLDRGNYWNRDNSDIVEWIRQSSFQAIAKAFERSGCATIDANHFVREKTERFVVYAATAVVENIAEKIMNDHELPSRISVVELMAFLAPARISTYKELWALEQERISGPPRTAELLAEIYRHWRGEAPPERDLGVLRFNITLEGHLAGLSLATMQFCDDIELA